MRKNPNSKYKYIFLFFVLANVALALYLKEESTKLSLILMGINLVVGTEWTFKCFGFKRALLLIALSFSITLALETLSMKTGYPYGHFKHNMQSLSIGQVPVLVCLAYFPLITIGWVFGDMVVKSFPVSKSSETIIRVFLASLVTVAIDILIDPVFSLVFKLWEYPNGGGLFGVPMSNSLGWMVNSLITLTLFELLSKKKWVRPQQRISTLYSPVCYLLLAQTVPLLIARLTLGNKIIPDITGTGWKLLDLYDCLSGFSLIIMGLLFIFGTISYETYEKAQKMKKIAK